MNRLTAKGWTMTDLAAEVSGVTRRYVDAPLISRVINGRRRSDVIVSAIEEILNIKIGDIPRNPYPKKTPEPCKINSERALFTMMDLGITRKDLAKQTGLSYDTVRWAVNGEKTPRRKTLEKIAEALGVPIEYLVGGVI